MKTGVHNGGGLAVAWFEPESRCGALRLQSSAECCKNSPMSDKSEKVSRAASSSPSVFLSFEGLDGSGKSTLIQGLRSQLETLGRRVTVTREPGGTQLAEDIRNLILRTGHESPHARTEILLYEASRAQHVEGVIRPALEQGAWVLCDRFSESTVAFQCFARGLDRGKVDWLNRFAEDGVRPSVVVLLDLTVEASRRRQNKRQNQIGSGPDRMEQEADEFHNRVRNGFLAQAKEEPERWLVLNAERSADQLLTDLIEGLEKKGIRL